MSIKDKDGKVFKLRGPNPIMKDQENWDPSQLSLINMKGWQEETVKDESNPVEKFKKDFNVRDIKEELGLIEGPEITQLVKAKDFIREIQEPVKVEIPVEETVVFNVDTRLEKIIKTRGAEYYCAPVIGTKEHIDDLYGDSHKSFQYGKSFLFDAVIVDESDFELQLWCVQNISLGSILYKKERSARWWKVNEITPKTGGYLMLLIPSEVNPDFSEDTH